MRKRSPMKQGKPLERKTPLRASSAQPKPHKGPKPKKCTNRACRAPYLPDLKRPWKNWCSDDCALVIALDKLAKQKATKAKAERAEDKAKKQQLKKKGDYLHEAQAAFNAYIRLRDRDEACICCGNPDARGAAGLGGGWDAGHWISRGHASHLRFHELNVHKQRKGCNRPGGTTRAKYRVGLVARVGEAAVQELEALEYAPTEKRWTVEELVEVAKTYHAKLRDLKKRV